MCMLITERSDAKTDSFLNNFMCMLCPLQVSMQLLTNLLGPETDDLICNFLAECGQDG
jgi:hypothetical protein